MITTTRFLIIALGVGAPHTDDFLPPRKLLTFNPFFISFKSGQLALRCVAEPAVYFDKMPSSVTLKATRLRSPPLAAAIPGQPQRHMASGPDPLMYFAPFPIYNPARCQLMVLKPAASALPVQLEGSSSETQGDHIIYWLFPGLC